MSGIPEATAIILTTRSGLSLRAWRARRRRSIDCGSALGSCCWRRRAWRRGRSDGRSAARRARHRSGAFAMPRSGLRGLDETGNRGARTEIHGGDRQAHSGAAGCSAAAGLCALDGTADCRRARRCRRAVCLALSARAEDRSRRTQIVVREQRSRVRRQGRRCGRPLHGAARERDRPLRRREALDPGAGAGSGLSEAAERPGADRP